MMHSMTKGLHVTASKHLIQKSGNGVIYTRLLARMFGGFISRNIPMIASSPDWYRIGNGTDLAGKYNRVWRE